MTRWIICNRDHTIWCVHQMTRKNPQKDRFLKHKFCDAGEFSISRIRSIFDEMAKFKNNLFCLEKFTFFLAINLRGNEKIAK